MRDAYTGELRWLDEPVVPPAPAKEYRYPGREAATRRALKRAPVARDPSMPAACMDDLHRAVGLDWCRVPRPGFAWERAVLCGVCHPDPARYDPAAPARRDASSDTAKQEDTMLTPPPAETV